MNSQERLFAAIGGADLYLLARSERRTRNRWPGYCLAAACLALVVTLSGVFSLWKEPSVVPPDTREPSIATIPDPPSSDDVTVPDGAESFLPSQGGEIGTLRLLSYVSSTEEEVDFLIYVNEEQFFIREDAGLYSIRNINPLPEDFPVCGLDIFHISGISPEETMDEAQKTYPLVNSQDLENPDVNCLPGSLYYRSYTGTEWDSEQTELWFVDDGQGGTFVLTARYFLEAEEGLGQCFRDMVSSFRVVSLSQLVPSWMRELYETADQLFPALFAGDLSNVSGLLTENAKAEAYGEDVWAEITVASVDYTLDDDRNPSRATVSVKHRLNRVEGDSFRYLTMELIRRDGKWLLSWSGIEQ